MFQIFNGTVEKETPPKMTEELKDTHFSYYNSEMFGYTT